MPMASTHSVEFSALAGRARHHLLIVDDDPTLASAIARLLETRGYSAEVYTDPRQALAAVEIDPHSFAAVLTDLSMPAMDGERFIVALRALSPELPIIVSTGRTAALGAAEELGVNEVLLKPWRLDEAVQALARSLD